jgi:hypothetical protein
LSVTLGIKASFTPVAGQSTVVIGTVTTSYLLFSGVFLKLSKRGMFVGT